MSSVFTLFSLLLVALVNGQLDISTWTNRTDSNDGYEASSTQSPAENWETVTPSWGKSTTPGLYIPTTSTPSRGPPRIPLAPPFDFNEMASNFTHHLEPYLIKLDVYTSNVKNYSSNVAVALERYAWRAKERFQTTLNISLTEASQGESVIKILANAFIFSQSEVEEALQNTRTAIETLATDVELLRGALQDRDSLYDGVAALTARLVLDIGARRSHVITQLEIVRRAFMAHVENFGAVKRHLILFKFGGKDLLENFAGFCNPRIGQYHCSNGKCISFVKVCNGHSECGDESDEPINCRLSCGSSYFRCDSGSCIAKRLVCDSKADCSDASDEYGC